MRLLITLTLGYVAVLVPALAASLIAIWVSLRGVASALGEARQALVRVQDATAPLAGHLNGVQDLVVAAGDGVAAAEARVAGARQRLLGRVVRATPVKVAR